MEISYKLLGIAVFKDKYFVGHLNELQSIAHLIVINDLNKCTLTIDNPFIENEQIDFDTRLYRNTNIHIEFINGSPFISITIFPEISVLSSGSTFNFVDDSHVNKLVNASNSFFEDLIKEYLYIISKEYNADIASFQGIYQSTFPTREDFSQINWENNFQNSFFEVKANTRIISSNLFNKE